MPPLHRLRALLRMDNVRDERLASLERELRRLRRDAQKNRKLMLRTQSALDALLRAAYVESESLPYPYRLTVRRFGIYSQNGEDGMLLALLRETGTATVRSFAEVGAGTNGGNSGFLARELGWAGLMVDGSAERIEELRLRFDQARVRMVHAFVTRENVNDLLVSNGFEGEIGVLSIDIDGNDIWVWEAVSAVRPQIAVVEYNALFGPSRSVAVPYAADRYYEPGAAYYGASLAALARVSERKGYRLVAVEPRGTNAFFVRDDVAPHVARTEPETAFAMLLAPSLLYTDPIAPAKVGRLRAREAELDTLVREQGLELVDVR